MKRSKIIIGLIKIVIFASCIGAANASIVNIDAEINSTSNPIILTLGPGTYSVAPIGVTDGGLFNAWNAWAGGCCPPSYAGWLNAYSLSSSEFSGYTVSDHTIYSSDLLALANAISTTFTLSSTTDVNFYIVDNPYFDNLGGMSLNVSAVPLPAPIWLFISGFIIIIGFNRVRN